MLLLFNVWMAGTSWNPLTTIVNKKYPSFFFFFHSLWNSATIRVLSRSGMLDRRGTIIYHARAGLFDSGSITTLVILGYLEER